MLAIVGNTRALIDTPDAGGSEITETNLIGLFTGIADERVARLDAALPVIKRLDIPDASLVCLDVARLYPRVAGVTPARDR